MRALSHWRASQPDVVLLDLTLPARDTVGDKVQGLNAGADDYRPKPFDLDELEARVRALHRRRPENMTELTSRLGASAAGSGRERLFRPFSAGEARSGSGLAICHEIVQALGGSINLDNREPHGRIVGLDTTVRLPLAHNPD